MLSITKKIAFAASLMVFCISNAWSTDHTDDIAPSPKGSLTLKNTATDIDPIFKELISCTPYMPTEVISIITGMISLINDQNQYYNGILQYTPEDGGPKIVLKFSDFKDGTFDISACGNEAQWQVITQSMPRFFIVEGENKDKLVTLVVLRQVVEQAVKEDPNHPFSPILETWPVDKPVGLFWRYGNYKNLAWFDYLTTSTLEEISRSNLFENWKKSSMARGGTDGWGDGRINGRFSYLFFEPK